MRVVNKVPVVDVREVGIVQEIAHGIVRASGLPNCVYGQLVSFERGQTGMVYGFDEASVAILVMGDHQTIKVGDLVQGAEELLSVPVGENFQHRIVDCLGRPIDGKGSINSAAHYPLFREAPGVMTRQTIEQPLLSGVKAIDSMLPLGKGQRQLIVGDRQVGKTSLALDCVLNQKNTGMISIYCFIGGTLENFEKAVHVLQSADILNEVIAVCAPAAASSAEQFICPYTATCLGEYFMRKGRDVLVVFDDLTKHAWAYRQLSLLLERSPGREAYPGDIFYIHAQLMERAGRLRAESGGGSMTFLPIAETQQGDLTGYIPSNLISMTDGQMYLNGQLFYQGFKPALDIGLSVSRLGAKVQNRLLHELCAELRIDYLRYRDSQRLTGLSRAAGTKAKEGMRRGECLEALLRQKNGRPVELAEEALLFGALSCKILEVVSDEQVQQFIGAGFLFANERDPDLVDGIRRETIDIRDAVERLEAVVREFFRQTRR